jgi:hypothetical protein
VNDLFAKLSSYNLFNNLLPGALYCTACTYLGMLSLDTSNLAGLLLTYYFVGLVIGRIGSVVIEPLVFALKWVRYSTYKNYVQASKTDAKIDILVETNNTYRALLSTSICLLGTLLAAWLRAYLPPNPVIDRTAALVGLMVLFFLAFRKQASYIRRRVEISHPSKIGIPLKE